MSVRYHYKTVKQVLRKSSEINTFFPGNYAFSPYQACEHGCVYCDGRAEKYYIDGEFDRDIVVRTNCAEVLDKQLKNIKETGIISISSGVSDAYQPIEEKEEITRECLRVIRNYRLGVNLLTKSHLVLRDLDILCSINRHRSVTVYVSLATLDDTVRTRFEPGASRVADRLRTIATMKENGLHVGVLAMPFLPGISDDIGHIERLYGKLLELQVDFIMPGFLTLRPGKQKELYLEHLEKHYTEQLDFNTTLYRQDWKSGIPEYTYRDDLWKQVMALHRKHEIPHQVPHRLYKDQFPLYEECLVLLTHLAALYQNRKADIHRLEQAVKKYRSWLSEEKSRLRRNRDMQQILEQTFKNQVTDGGLLKLIENERLLSFIQELVLDRKTFDYRMLKFI
jgi:DNA repair photolyase